MEVIKNSKTGYMHRQINFWALAFFFVVTFFCGSAISVSAQYKAAGHAKIRFVDDEKGSSKTYLGRLTKGDMESLKFELQHSFGNTQTGKNDKSKTELEGYVGRVTSKNHKKSWKNRNKDAKDNLIGNYNVKDEKSLQQVKQKHYKEKEKRATKFGPSENYKSYSEATNAPRPNSYMSKHYKIRGKRLRNGHSFRRKAGPVSLIIKYKIRENDKINTYINVVEDYLQDGSKYNLKYHGSGPNRKYYFEFVSNPNR